MDATREKLERKRKKDRRFYGDSDDDEDEETDRRAPRSSKDKNIKYIEDDDYGPMKTTLSDDEDEDEDEDEGYPTKKSRKGDKGPDPRKMKTDEPIDPDVELKKKAEDARRARQQSRYGEDLNLGAIHARGGVVRNVEGEEEQNNDDDNGGIQIEPFNLKEERETGYFDENGMYVPYKFKDVRDSWLEELDEGKITGSKTGSVERTLDSLAGQRKKFAAETKEDEDNYMSEEKLKDQIFEWKKTIISILKPNETVLDALKRLRPPKKVSGATAKKRREKAAAAANGQKAATNDTQGEAMSAEDQAKQQQLFEKLTEAADGLLSNGFTNVYSDKYDKFEEEVELEEERRARAKRMEAARANANANATQAAAAASPSAAPAAATTITTTAAAAAATTTTTEQTMWEYKWSPDATAPVYGPFSTQTMLEWHNQGLFQSNDVYVRRVKGDEDDIFGDDDADSKKGDFVPLSSINLADHL